MTSTLGIRGAKNTEEPEYTKVDVYINGEKVDSLIIVGSLKRGIELESEAISRALEGRQVINIFFLENTVTIHTEPE